MKKMLVLSLVAVLTGCAGMIPQPVSEPADTVAQPVTVIHDSDDMCLVSEDTTEFEHQCDLIHWANMWIKADATAWPQRKARIDELGDTLPDTIERVILSLPVDTPYQARLRAQHWIKSISDKLSPALQPLVKTMVDAPNNEMLELESALVILNKVNAEQAQASEALQHELETQQKKLEELLEIEATLMDKNRSSQQ